MNSKEKRYRFIDPAAAAFLTLLITFFIFYADHRFPTQRLKTYIWSDEFAQYICVIKLFFRNLFSGESLQYTFTQGLGMEIFPEYINICFSPFNLFFVFIEDANAAAFFAAAFKYASAAAAFALLTEYISGERELQGICFGTAYALCGFALGGYVNIMFLDILYITPLLTLGLIRLYRSGKWIFTALVYAYSFITNFYMGFILGVFSAVFFGALILTGLYKADAERKKDLRSLSAKWILSGAVSVMLSAVTLLPAAEYFLSGGEKDSNPPGFVHPELLEFLKAFIKGGFKGIDSDIPLVYCGAAAVIFALVFFVDGKRKKRDKIITATMLSVLILCTFVPVCNRFIHGGSYPHQFAFRFSFLYSFILCLTAAMEWGYLRRERKGFSAILRILTAVFICADCIVRGADTIGDIQDDQFPADYDTWTEYNDRGNKAGDAMKTAAKEDGISFYRVRTVRSITEDQGSYFGWNTMEIFNSFGNEDLGRLLVKLGIAKSYASISDLGNNPLTDMIFSEYYILNDIFADKAPSVGQISRNKNILPPAFMSETGILDFSISNNENVFENLNDLSVALGGEKCFLTATETFGEGGFSIVPEVYPEYTELYADDKYVYIEVPEGMGEENGYAAFKVPESEKGRAYVYITLSDHEIHGSYIGIDSPWLYSGEEDNGMFASKKIISRPFIDEIKNYNGSGQYFYVVFDENSIKKIVCRLPLIYYEDMAAVGRMYEKLEQESLEVSECGEGYIKGKIITEKGGPLFIAVPYSRHWRLKDKGKKVEIVSVLDKSFMAVDLAAGEHEIELVYDDPYIRAGVCLSLITLICLAGMQMGISCRKINSKCFYKQRREMSEI